MSQHDYVISNDIGSAVRADINNALGAIATINSGATEPSTTYAYQLWMDTSSNVLKIRNSANSAWYTLPISPVANNTVDINGGTVDGITSLTQTNVAADATDVELKYSGSTKLATTSTGIDVTGTVTADGSVRLDSTTPLYRGVSSLSASGSTVGQVRFDATHTPSSTIYTGPSVEALKDDADYATGIKIKTTASSGSNLARFYAASNGDISFYEDTGTTAKFFWDASAESLGIGTSSLAAWGSSYRAIQVGGMASLSSYYTGGDAESMNLSGNAYHDGSGWKYIGSEQASMITMVDGHTIFKNAGSSAGTAGAAITWSERMRIDSSGNLLVGTTVSTPEGNNAGSSADNGIALQGSVGAISACRYSNVSGIFNRTGTDGLLIQFRKSGTLVGSVSVTGSSTAYNTSSDYRLKEDWQPMSGSIDRLKALNPVNFAWKADGSRVDGFLAHEAAEVVPEAVTGEKDAVEAIGNVTDAEGTVVQENVTEPEELAEGQTWTKTEDRPVYQGIDQSKLTPLLTAALQEAIAKIEALETRIAALEA